MDVKWDALLLQVGVEKPAPWRYSRRGRCGWRSAACDPGRLPALRAGDAGLEQLGEVAPSRWAVVLLVQVRPPTPGPVQPNGRPVGLLRPRSTACRLVISLPMETMSTGVPWAAKAAMTPLVYD